MNPVDVLDAAIADAFAGDEDAAARAAWAEVKAERERARELLKEPWCQHCRRYYAGQPLHTCYAIDGSSSNHRNAYRFLGSPLPKCRYFNNDPAQTECRLDQGHPLPHIWENEPMLAASGAPEKAEGDGK